MFDVFDHVSGGLKVRLRRFFLSIRGDADLSFVNPNLAIGGSCRIQSLWKNGIQAILDLREEAEDDHTILKKYSILYRRIACPDGGTPNAEDMIDAINWIKSNLEDYKKLFIHCNLGRGRAPLVACIYLISQGMNAGEAISLVKNIRKYTYFNSNQAHYIYEFKRYMT